jgi:retron-type reverse transcriptase
LENLLEAWQEFAAGKRSRPDVLEFERDLAGNLIRLHERLADFSYRHGPYERFAVADPKPRVIHKAAVADRVLHRALYRKLYPFFDRTFIADSFSCREGKGTHAAIARFASLARRASGNHRRTVWALKCDIRRFFASIDHGVLMRLVGGRVADGRVAWLVGQVVGSHCSSAPGVGLPLGNLTSQLFANVYLNELDRFVKHRLKARHYVRYADDFVLLSPDRARLEAVLPRVEAFLRDELRLRLHPDKVSIFTVASGVDFLGHRVLRTATKRRMFSAVSGCSDEAVVASYRGMLKHGNAEKLLALLDEQEH